MKQRWGLVIVIAAVSFLSGGWLLQRRVVAAPAHADSAELFQRVLSTVVRNYVDTVTTDSIYHNAAIGLVDELNDPYSVLEENEDYSSLREQTTGNYGGLGMQIDVRDGWITIVAPLPQTPAERAGIVAGDQIIEVDGKSTQGIKQDDALKVLRGPVGTKVELRVRRPGSAQILPFALVREQIHNRSTQPGVLIDGSIGFVQLNIVSEQSAAEVKEEVTNLLKAGMKGLVIDLRRNPGGLLDQGVAVADLFLNPGQQIVSTRGRMTQMNEIYTDAAPQSWPQLPIVVLVNEFSASASEIIAGALQDNDRAAVVGTSTFGKGLVQSLFQVGPGQALKLTTGRWYTPSGRTIQRIAKSQEDQLRQATDDARDSTRELPNFKTISGRTVKGGGGIVPDRIVRSDTLTDPEKVFAKALGSNVSAYQDALVGTALWVKERKLVSAENFVISDAMRAEVMRRLHDRKIEIDSSSWTAGSTLVNEQLGYQIARYVFGRQAELRRTQLDDPQFRAAADLLRKASNPQALMAQLAR